VVISDTDQHKSIKTTLSLGTAAQGKTTVFIPSR